MALDLDMTILLVEDSDLTRKMELQILTQVGFNNVLEARNGEEAIQKLNQEPDIKLIISDWNMPEKGGYDLLVEVRSEERWKDVPFIMATAQAEKKQARKAVEAGVSGFISKPFSAPELRYAIEETFGIKSEGRSDGLGRHRPPRKTASGKVHLSVAHIQITDHLTLGVLKHLIASGALAPERFELETLCMPSWNPVQKALETGDIDAAFVLAPIAMDLFGVGAPMKLVLFAHKNGSICVGSKQVPTRGSLQEFFRGKTFYIPHMLSIHHMLSTMLLREIGLRPGVAGQEGVDVLFEVVPPIKMPEFLAKHAEVCGYTVAEPLGTKAIASGTGDLMLFSGELWQDHPCCVVVVRDELIQDYPDAVQEFVTMLVQAGQFIAQQPDQAAEIAVTFLDPKKNLGLKAPVLKKVLTEPQGIKTDDLFPVIEDLDRIQHYMVEEMGIGTLIDLDKFMDVRFAEKACDAVGSVRRTSRMHDLSQVISRLIRRFARDYELTDTPKKGGKRLIFDLDHQEYGVDIVSVKEIIGMTPIRSVPQTPPFVKGVINLRGKVIPVIDLRIKLGMAASDYNERTCIIVMEVKGKKGTTQVGMVVDSVSEVLNLRAEDIEDPPSLGGRSTAEMILGMAKAEGRARILLNTDRLLGGHAAAINP
ncbi:MAG: chemotaxis protein CheW [Deltaproteobacteria bacterium]|nr:chemotaxis protein CheW [Deltaproteobacteria bacterium]